MPTATISDVTEIISTNLDTSSGGPVDDSLNYAEEWNSSTNDPTQQTTTETKNIERWAAVVNIRQHKERSVEEDETGDSSAVYEGDELRRAKSELANWLRIAGEDVTSASSLLRDTDRYTGST